MSINKNLLRCWLFAVVFFVCILSTGCSNTIKLNRTVDIKKDKIKITVLESENTTIDNGKLSLSNGDYTKVKISIENTGDDTYSWTILNFQLGDEGPALNALAEEDSLPLEAAAGKTITGYLYFPKNDSTTLEYISSGLDGNAEKFEFNIK